uniref:Uncharacterized protein n=1 Tax=Solibacter usitatus (strain Ellin6076) TaxID=234267 RepID=Q020R7_SOLUE
MTDHQLAYISQGQLHLQRYGEGEGELLESPFGRSLKDRAIQIHNRNAWKLQGRGGQSLSRALHSPADRDPAAFRITITSVARGLHPGHLFYTLETDETSGVFTRDAAGLETRLFHTADFRARHLDPHPDGSEVALSIHHRNGLANLALLKSDGTGLTEITEGESVDQAPRWVPGPGRRLVYQSAGMARDPQARFSGFGPSSIRQLDLDTGDVSCLAQDDNFDFLWPRIAAGGELYYIRKPNGLAPQPVVPWVALKATLALPFRILWLIAKLFEISLAHCTGQPLVPPTAAPKAVRTPSSWLLMRQPPGAAEAQTIAEGALSFDLAADGSVIYSTGIDVFRIPPNGAPAARILAAVGIDLVAAL